MLTALHDISIGDLSFKAGEVIPAEAQLMLPPRRLEQLKAQRHVGEITDEASLAEQVADLAARVAELEAASKPATPRKRKVA